MSGKRTNKLSSSKERKNVKNICLLLAFQGAVDLEKTLSPASDDKRIRKAHLELLSSMRFSMPSISTRK